MKQGKIVYGSVNDGLFNGKKKIINYHVLIFLLILISYFPTFTGSFILDDFPLIKNNSYLKELHSLDSYLAQEDGVVGESDKGIFHTGYYRPLINITYSIDYALWGMNPSGFRTTNLILHVLSCYLLFSLICLLNRNKLSAFWVTALFSIHPVNTESVSWVISRNNILVTLFILASLYFYILSLKKRSYLVGSLSLLSFIAAVFSKEFGIMLIPVLFLSHRLLLYKSEKPLIEAMHYVPYLIILMIYFLLRKNVIGAYLTPFDANQILWNICLVPFLLIKNLIMIFIPHKLHYLYASYPDSILDIKVLGSLLIFIACIIVMWILRNNKLIIFSGISFIIFLFPVLNIIPSASTKVTLVSMRWLYLPMAFLCIGVAELIKNIIANHQRLAQIVLIMIIVYFGSYTYILNRYLWHDEKAFFEQEVIGFGNDFFSGDLAEKYLEEGKTMEAEKLFEVAIKKYPDQAYNFINYSALLIQTGRPESAIEILYKAKDLKLTHHKRGEWLNNMGAALFLINKKDEAISYFRKAVLYTPEEAEFWINLAGAYGSMGDFRKSIASAEEGLRVAQDSDGLLRTIAIGYINLNEYDKALEIIKRLPESERYKDNSISNFLKTIQQKN